MENVGPTSLEMALIGWIMNYRERTKGWNEYMDELRWMNERKEGWMNEWQEQPRHWQMTSLTLKEFKL